MGRKTHIATAIDHARKGAREASLHAWCCIKARLSCAKGQAIPTFYIRVIQRCEIISQYLIYNVTTKRERATGKQSQILVTQIHRKTPIGASQSPRYQSRYFVSGQRFSNPSTVYLSTYLNHSFI